MNTRNLKLGYGGTKTEMERLLADAEKISGVHYDISNLSDVYNAIHVIQGELGITGTTAKEASETISGSVASAKSAFKDFLSGQGGIEEVISTFTTAGKNIAKGVMKVFPQVTEGIVGIINGLIPLLPEFIGQLLPPLIQGATNLLIGLVNALPQFITVLAGMLPSLITTLIQGAVTVTQALAQQLPTLMPVIVSAILDGILAILDNIDLVIDAGIQLLMGFTDGIINALPILIEKAPEILEKFTNAVIDNTPKLMSVGPTLILKLGEGILKNLPNLLAKIPGMVGNIIKLFGNAATQIFPVGKNIVKGLWNGISNMASWFWSKITGFASGIIKKVTSILGIHSPSTEFALIGKFSVLGYTEQLDKMSKEVQGQIAETFSVSPQLANSSSLHYSPNVIVNTTVNQTQDPLGRMVNDVKTFSGGARNDFNYGMGV